MSRQAEAAARAVLQECGITAAPVDVEQVARQLGLDVEFEVFDDDVSGVLVRDEAGKATVGVNRDQAPARRRFTIAHELGHFRMHEGWEVIVEKTVRVNFRDRTSGLATNEEEIQANAFAAELLMPRSLVERHVGEKLAQQATAPTSWTDADVKGLADVFGVSRDAMAFRLANLGLRPLI